MVRPTDTSVFHEMFKANFNDAMGEHIGEITTVELVLGAVDKALRDTARDCVAIRVQEKESGVIAFEITCPPIALKMWRNT